MLTIRRVDLKSAPSHPLPDGLFPISDIQFRRRGRVCSAYTEDSLTKFNFRHLIRARRGLSVGGLVSAQASEGRRGSFYKN